MTKSTTPITDLSADIRQILECLPNPAIMLSTDYRILEANAAYRDVYNFGDKTIDKRCHEVSHGYSVPCDMAGESCPLKESLKNRESTQVLHIHHTPKGEEYVNVDMWPVLDSESGEVRYFIEQMHPSEAGATTSAPDRLIGRSPAFQKMLSLIERVAPSEANVVLLGESGTGKDLVAQTTHRLSERKDGPFVPVECTGLPESLFESELFGHLKGSFTGAASNKQGLVAAAEGGTLFLDEIGDVPLSEQVKLLRLLETRRYRPVGSSEQHEADFRLICATNKDLPRLVKEGQFREDLYYRLCVFEIELPPLRDRTEDLVSLIQTMVDRLGLPKLSVDAQALRCLEAYPFPGNIRELRNIVERAALLSNDGVISVEHLPAALQGELGTNDTGDIGRQSEITTLEDAEKNYLRGVMKANTADRRELARKLGISERVLYRKLAELRES